MQNKPNFAKFSRYIFFHILYVANLAKLFFWMITLILLHHKILQKTLVVS